MPASPNGDAGIFVSWVTADTSDWVHSDNLLAGTRLMTHDGVASPFDPKPFWT